MQNSLKRMWALLGVVAAIAAVAATQAVAAHKAGPTIVIWTDADRAAAVTKVANDWAGSSGATIKVVDQELRRHPRQPRHGRCGATPPTSSSARTTGPASSPPTASCAPLFLKQGDAKQFPKYTLDAFSYGTAVKKLYGVPVAVENIGLVVNTKLAKVPTTFAQLEKRGARRSRRRSTSNLGIAVQQGSGGDAYHMYPFFSGLGGYVFGTNKAGNLDPSDIGVANPLFLKNAQLIDKWNKEGLINSKVDCATAQNAFLKGQAAFWVTGPWDADTLKKSGLSFKVIQVPAIVEVRRCRSSASRASWSRSSPRRTASTSAAKDLVANYMTTPGAQTQLAAANGRLPGEHQGEGQLDGPGPGAVRQPREGRRPDAEHPADGLASGRTSARRGSSSTKGSGAMTAAKSFKAAARSIADKIG